MAPSSTAESGFISQSLRRVFISYARKDGADTAHAATALAHVQLGRVFALSGDKTRAKAAYETFLALWKGADSDIPILKSAKAEYGRLQ
jgi:hypothetical protein